MDFCTVPIGFGMAMNEPETDGCSAMVQPQGEAAVPMAPNVRPEKEINSLTANLAEGKYGIQ